MGRGVVSGRPHRVLLGYTFKLVRGPVQDCMDISRAYFLFFFLFFLFLIHLYWSIIVSQCCASLLYNKMNQQYAYVYPHILSLLSLPPTLPIPPLQVVTKHGADLPVLCSGFPLAIDFTFGSVYMATKSIII